MAGKISYWAAIILVVVIVALAGVAVDKFSISSEKGGNMKELNFIEFPVLKDVDEVSTKRKVVRVGIERTKIMAIEPEVEGKTTTMILDNGLKYYIDMQYNQVYLRLMFKNINLIRLEDN